MLQAYTNDECFTASNSEPEEPTELQKRDLGERREQHRELQLKARAIFAAVKGRPGIRGVEDFTRIMVEVTGDYESGKFLLEQLGADRLIDFEKTLTLGYIREKLVAGIERPTMADKLAADSAVIAYHNILRLQAWIGNIALVVERDLFGQAPLDEIHGQTVGQKLADDLRRLEHQIFPLMDRAHRMLMRSLNYLEGRGGGAIAVNVGQADHVNVGSVVANRHG